MIRRCLLVLSILAFVPVARAAGDGIHVRTLENGLKVVVKEDHSKPLAALRVYVGTGGALEMKYLGTGISHYYEHLLAGGSTSNRTEAQSAQILRELGGQSNAYTTSNYTCYFVTTTPKLLPKALDLYADWMENNILAPSEVAREKGVILKEMNKDEDEPSRVLYLLFLSTMFRVHPIRVPNIGYRSLFEKLTRKDLQQYLKNRYAPNNAVVAVAGDVDPDAVFAQVKKAFGSWKRRPVPVVNLPKEPRQTSPRFAEKEMDVDQARVRMGWHTIDLFDPDLYALDMVAAVLGEGRSSRLYRRVVEEDGLTDGINASSWTPSFMKGVFAVSFSAPVDKVGKIRAAVMDEIARLKGGPVSEAELERAKTFVISRYQLSVQAVEDQAEEVGTDLLTTGDARFSEEYVRRIREVTPKEVVAAARKYLVPDGVSTAQVVPLGSEKKAAAKEENASRKTVTKEVVLSNGLRLIVRQTPGVAPVGVEMFSLGGLRAEPKGKNGLSFLTARMLLRGTKTRSAEDIARQVEDAGAQIRSSSGNNTMNVSLTLARGKRDLPFAASLLADVLGNSTFPKAEFAKQKRFAQMIASRQKADWQTEAIDFFRSELYGSTPYGHPVVGTVKSISNVTRDDVVAFARKFLDPKAMVVAVAGDADPEAAVKILSGPLGALKSAGTFSPPTPAVPAWAKSGLEKNRRAFLPNDKKQAVLSVTFPAARFTNIRDRAALAVIDAFTSGIDLPSGWFQDALRGGDESLVYFVHFVVFTGMEPGCSFVYTQCEPKLLPEVYSRVMKQIDRLRQGDFTKEDLEIGRNMELVSEPYDSQTVSDVATDLALNVLYGTGVDGQKKFRDAVRAVTRKDVLRVVKRYFGHELITVTGPASVRPIFDSLK